MKLALLMGFGLCATTLSAAPSDSGIEYEHGFSYLWPLKYPADFDHFDAFNPDAPKGGIIRVPQLGTYDTFNSYIDRGREAAGMAFLSPSANLFYDRLMTGAPDDVMGSYGRLAEGVRLADDYSWVAFKIRDNAYWHDGVPITVDDLIFSFEIYKSVAKAWIITMIADVDRIEQIGPREVRYIMKEGITPNPAIARPIGVMPVLPRHYWASRDPSKVTTEPPLGSGPYRIKEFRLGRYVTYERIDDYWGKDLPSMKGRFNFQEIKFDYFRDTQVMMEALRGHLVDIRIDGNAKNWAVEYNFPAVNKGWFRKEVIAGTNPVGLDAPIFWNLRREQFRDIRVREALLLLYDFEFVNRVIRYAFFERGRSVFHGAKEMEQKGIPTGRELELLEPFRAQLPPRLFSEPYQPPVNDGYGIDRKHVEQAIRLFAEAGWQLDDGKLVNGAGEQFTIDFILISHAQAKELLPYMDILKRVGIETSIRVPEASNWLYRMQTSSFDAGMARMPPYRTPGIALRNHWGSDSAEAGFGVNWAYVKNPVIDALAETVVGATDSDTFLAAVNAADRVLMWNFYFIPVTAQGGTPLVYWDKFGRKDTGPIERVPWMDGWWWDEKKAKRIEEGLAAQEADDG